MKTFFVSMFLLMSILSCKKEKFEEPISPVPQAEIKSLTTLENDCYMKFELCIQKATFEKSISYNIADAYGGLGPYDYSYAGKAIATVALADQKYWESCEKCKVEYYNCKNSSPGGF